MIISHRHKFIYIKTRKTASTSLEIALSRICGPDDIITLLCPEDEAKRLKLGVRGAQNYYFSFRTSFNDPVKVFQLLKRRKRCISFGEHISAKDIREQIDNHIWNSYFKFTVERNPWDQLVSRYFWARESDEETFDHFIKRIAKKGKISNFDLYSIDGKIAVDKVFMYEKLDQEMLILVKVLGLKEQLVLPRAKGGYRPPNSRKNYQSLFGDLEHKLVYKYFSREIDTFGYQFEQ